MNAPITNQNFRTHRSDQPLEMPFGTVRFLSSPPLTGARQLTSIDAVLYPGQGHAFHRHPDQEEVIYIAEGTVEQWIDDQKRNLSPGDAVFIPAGLVHASYNVGTGNARLIVTFGPCRGDGFTTIDMTGERPWSGLRGSA